MRAMGRVALESEEALAVVYERGLKAAGEFYAEQFETQTVVADADWIQPAGRSSFDSEESYQAAVAQREDAARAIEEEFSRGITDTGISFDPDAHGLFSPDLMEGLGKRAGANFDAAATEQLGQTVLDSFNQGLSVPDTAKAIREKFGAMSGHTATMLARTDLIGMANGGSYMGAKIVYAKQPASKTWINAHDARVRPSHAAAGGQTVPMDAPFSVGGHDLMYPGDPQGPNGEVINCRCTFTVKPGKAIPKEDQQVAVDFGGGFVAPPKGDTALTIFGPHRDTRELFARLDESGEWQWFKSRQEGLHKPIMALELDKGSPVRKGQTPTTLFLAGGSGVGKSTVRRGLKGWEDGGSKKAVSIDADGIKELIPEYKRMIDDLDEYSAAGTHEESSMLAKAINTEANKRRMNSVYDGTGDGDPGDFLGKIRKAQAAGRDVEVVIVDVPVEDAILRVNARGVKTGRHIHENTVKDIHQKVSARFPEYRDEVDWQIWSTFNPEEVAIRRRKIPDEIKAMEKKQMRELVAEKKGGVETIHNPEKFQQFLDKADPASGG